MFWYKISNENKFRLPAWFCSNNSYFWIRKQKKRDIMENEKSIADVCCPLCGESLIFPNPRWETKIGENIKTTIFLRKTKEETKNGTQKKRTFLRDLEANLGPPFDRVLFFLIVAGNNRSGFLELSTAPKDYSKYSSISLHPEEEVKFICPYCHNAISENGFVKILVEFKSKRDEVWEYFLSARYGVEITLYQKDGEIGSYCGSKFKSTAKYLEQKLKKIYSRK